MKSQFTLHLNYTAVVLAIGSFIIGTLLFLAFKFTNAGWLITVGFGYILFAVILNSFILIALCINAISNYKYYGENILTIVGVLLNIPITLLYLDLSF